MNSNSFIELDVFIKNSTIIESWFIPLDIFMIVCCILIIILTIFLQLIIILDKTCHTVPMMLVFNSYLSALICGCSTLSLCIFTFKNDLNQIQYQDSLCILRSYCIYTGGALFNYSFLLQALYRYLIVIYPARLLFQSFRFQILIIGLIWIFCFIYPFVFLFNNQIIYNVDNQICQLPLYFSFSMIYMSACIFMNPVLLIMFIYWKLIRYVRGMSNHVTAANIMIRAQRELKMVQRTVILVTVLVIICLPYTLIMFMGFFNHAPKYQYRISYVFVNVSGLATIIILFQFTDPLKSSLMKRIKWRPNLTVPTMT